VAYLLEEERRGEERRGEEIKTVSRAMCRCLRLEGFLD